MDWAWEAFDTARDDVYGQLSAPNERGSYRLSEDYVAMATEGVATRLRKAGVRLAYVLSTTLAAPPQ